MLYGTDFSSNSNEWIIVFIEEMINLNVFSQTIYRVLHTKLDNFLPFVTQFKILIPYPIFSNMYIKYNIKWIKGVKLIMWNKH